MDGSSEDQIAAARLREQVLIANPPDGPRPGALFPDARFPGVMRPAVPAPPMGLESPVARKPRPVPRAATQTIALWTVVIGVFGDIALRTGLATLGGFSALVLIPIAMLTSNRLVTRTSRLLAMASLAFSPWCLLRSVGWLITIDVMAAMLLFMLAASYSSEGMLWATSAPRLFGRVFGVLEHAVRSGPFALRPLRPRRSAHWHAVLRGIAIALPVVVILGALLASADVVFASFLRFEVNGWNLVGHVALIGLCAVGIATLFRSASTEASSEPEGWATKRHLRRVEMLVVMLALDGLFALWAGAQIAALTSAGDRVLRTRGLTYAEYARSGFFQLLWVAGITIAVVAGVRAALVSGDNVARKWFARTAVVLLAFTLAMVVVSVQRLSLYERQFGWTTLRLVVHVSAVGIGLLIILLAVSCVPMWARCNWFPMAAMVTMAAVIATLNVMNPEEFVAARNVRRAPSSMVPFDYGYLASLSDEAVPSAVGALRELAANDAATLRAELCAREPIPKGWLNWNRSASRAQRALDRLQCAESERSPTTSGRD